MIFDLKCESEEAFWTAFDRVSAGRCRFDSLTCEANTVIRIACKIKEKSNPIIVIGGNHATYDPDYFNRAEFDYIVIGLGKKSFSELISRLDKGKKGAGIAGVAQTSPGKPLAYVTRNYDETDLMDDVPPRYDLVAKYQKPIFSGAIGSDDGVCHHRLRLHT